MRMPGVKRPLTLCAGFPAYPCACGHGRRKPRRINSAVPFPEQWTAWHLSRPADTATRVLRKVHQVVPHEVAGMANYTKNLFVGTVSQSASPHAYRVPRGTKSCGISRRVGFRACDCAGYGECCVGQGGKAAIDLSHFIGAVYGMENMMGRPGGPVSAPLRPLHGTPWTIVLWYSGYSGCSGYSRGLRDTRLRDTLGTLGTYHDYGYGGRRCARF